MFEEIYTAFKKLYYKWLGIQLGFDAVAIAFAVYFLLKANTVGFIVTFVVFTVAELLLVRCLFGSLKGMTEYLNLNGRYLNARKSGDEAAILEAQQAISDYLNNR